MKERSGIYPERRAQEQKTQEYEAILVGKRSSEKSALK